MLDIDEFERGWPRMLMEADTAWGPSPDRRRCLGIGGCLDTFEGLKMSYPKTSADRERELQSIRKELTK